MFRRRRLRKAHALFLQSSRNLKEGRQYWKASHGLSRWFLQIIFPVPLLGLQEEGDLLLSALRWMEANCKGKPLGEDTIRHYHGLVLPTADGRPSTYRRSQVSIVGSSIPRPPAERVGALMKRLDQKLARVQSDLDQDARKGFREDVLAIALEAHQGVALIHPFPDANGRVARLAMNHILRRYDMGYVIFPPLDESVELFNAIEESHKGRIELLQGFARSHYHRV